MCGDNHVDAYGTGLLGDTCHRSLDFFACSHNQVGKLVDYHHDVRHEVVAVFGIEFVIGEFLVVFHNIAHTGFAQQSIALVHQHAQGV